MKRKSIYAFAAIAALLTSCSNDMDVAMGEGTVSFDISISSDIKESRATSDELAQDLGSSFKLWLTRKSGQAGVIRTYDGLDNMPTSLSLAAGSYLAEAWAGDSVSASFTDRWFKGSADFDVTAGAVTPVSIKCKIANVVVSVEYGDGVLDNYNIDSLYVSHKRGALSFKPGENDRGYFMMPSSDPDLAWTFIGTRKSDGAVKTFSGTLPNVKSAYEYKFNINFAPNTPGDTHVGGAYFDIEIITTETPVNDAQIIYSAPIIDGVYNNERFDLDQQFSVTGDPGRVQMYVTASSELKSIQITCDDFPTLLGITSTSVDIVTINNSSIISTLNNGGLTWTRTSNSTAETYNALITLLAELTAKMDWEKLYSIQVTATDANGWWTTKTLLFKKTQAPLSTAADATNPSALAADMVSATTFTVTGDILQDISDDIYVDYTADASRADNRVKATIEGNKYIAQLTGLTPGTTYQYTVTCGDYTSDPVKFKTEEALQLPNSGFEEWQISSSPYLVYASGSQMFWDSGNHGSATMNKNITIPDSDIKHSGNYSIKLESQFVGIGLIGKFAAGNVFIGEYLGTDGTDGIIGFGRSFTGRPKGLKGWVRYEPGTIAYTSNDAPEYVKGELDKGIIYMALLDDKTINYNGKKYPVVVKTKTKELFNKDGENVIAYGEIIWNAATDGDGMVEFEVNFEYKRTDERPSYILVTAAASKGGDYFAGGNSTMWLDDIELVY